MKSYSYGDVVVWHLVRISSRAPIKLHSSPMMISSPGRLYSACGAEASLSIVAHHVTHSCMQDDSGILSQISHRIEDALRHIYLSLHLVPIASM